jgi:Ca-activated chloride channel homolog
MNMYVLQGFYNEHFFETGTEAEKILSATFAPAISRDPISGESEFYISVGMNSKYDGAGFQKCGGRPQLNFVVLLDVSGSMGSNISDAQSATRYSKLQLAKDSLKTLISKLSPADSFALLTFDSAAKTVIPLTRVGTLDASEMAQTIDAIRSGGSTNLSAGLTAAYSSLTDIPLESPLKTNSDRVFVITDDQTNTGDTQAGSLVDIIRQAADREIYTTTIATGIDFQSDLVREMNGIKACCYLTARSNEDFRRTMDEDFDFLMTPVAFEACVTIQSADWEIERIFGSPGSDERGDTLRIASVFPSQKRSNCYGDGDGDGDAASFSLTKGGIVLLKLARKTASSVSGTATAAITLTYADVDGFEHIDTTSIDLGQLSASGEEYYHNDGVRKAVAITRYVNMLQQWASYEFRSHAATAEVSSLPPPPPLDQSELLETSIGALPPFVPDPTREDWGHCRVPYKVSQPYPVMFETFAHYFKGEMSSLSDFSQEEAFCAATVNQLKQMADFQAPRLGIKEQMIDAHNNRQQQHAKFGLWGKKLA